jgi:hypothetical protein
MNLRYQLPKSGPWIDFTWRFDTGQVAGSVPDLAAALALTADEQTAIGFYCGATYASLVNRISSCSGTYGATRLVIPLAGTANPDTNPPRIAPHSILDLGIGDDNVLHTEKVKLTLKLSILNLTNEVALYNFLSTFSGTHFVTPRSLTLTTGVVF